MARRKRIAGWLVLTAAMVWAAAVWWHAREPICHGKKASVWLEEYYRAGFQEDSEAAQVLKECGGKLVPYLRKILRKRTSRGRLVFLKYVPKKFAPKVAPGSLYPQHTQALKTLQLLGKEAEPATPELLEFFKVGHSASLQVEVFQVVRAMGPEGTRILQHNLGHKDPWVRFHCATVLLTQNPGNQAAGQAMTNLMAHTNAWVADVASNTARLLIRPSR